MTANQSTVKSDMATVDYGSFQPTKHHCLLSNCLSYPKKRKTELRGRAFPSARPVQRSYALGSNTHKALMSPLRHASGSRQSENSAHFFGVNRSNVRDSFFLNVCTSWDSRLEQQEAKVYGGQLIRRDYRSRTAAKRHKTSRRYANNIPV